MKADSIRNSILWTPAGATVTLTLVGIIGYVTWTFTNYYSTEADLVVAGISQTLLFLLLAAFGLALALRADLVGHLRRGWLLISLGGASLAFTYGVTFAQRALQTGDLPANINLFHLAYYALLFVGLLQFPAALVISQQRSILYLDLLIILLGFSMVYLYLLPDPSLVSINPNQRNLWTIVFPLGDFLILAAVIALAQRDMQRPARWMLLFIALGMIFATIADLFFSNPELTDIDQTITQHTLWMCSALSLCYAGAQQFKIGIKTLSDLPKKSSSTLYLLRLVLPYLAVGLSLLLLILVVISEREIGFRLLGILSGAVVMVALVLLQQYLVLKENVRLYQTVQRIAWTDGLTGLYNRHFFNEILPREIDRARRYQEHLAVMLLDVDGFKKYNDTYGHLEGDAVLKSVSHAFASQLRSSDTIARFGGDEFVIILPSANRRTAQTIAGRIQGTLAKLAFNGRALGVSIGIGVYREGQSPEQLLEETDKDLYRHKANHSNGKDKGFG
jgi:diguanylate cyclase (GGDEF)-like protein